MYRIVSVSNNLRLLINRNDALAIAGYSVVSPRVPEETPLLLHRERADAVVIGHSIPAEERETLIAAIRAVTPALPIIFVYQKPAGAPEPRADVSLDVTDSPGPLIEYLVAKLERPVAAD
jgi:DNA-binding NtrC family response regulator